MLKASVIGNLGNDPELRYSPIGAPSLRVNVASNFRARTPEGEREDRTEWVRVIVFGQRVESLAVAGASTNYRNVVWVS
jgi:single-strand DNA-binding protein